MYLNIFFKLILLIYNKNIKFNIQTIKFKFIFPTSPKYYFKIL